MAKGNSSLISELQSKDISTQLGDSLREADLVWKGFNYKDIESSEDSVIPAVYTSLYSIGSALTTEKKSLKISNLSSVYGSKVDINRALFWLASESGDYGRNYPFKGGNLSKYLGKVMGEENIEEWEKDLKERFNEEFGDLEIIHLRMLQDASGKKLYIFLFVRNKRTGLSNSVKITVGD